MHEVHNFVITVAVHEIPRSSSTFATELKIFLCFTTTTTVYIYGSPRLVVVGQHQFKQNPILLCICRKYVHWWNVHRCAHLIRIDMIYISKCKYDKIYGYRCIHRCISIIGIIYIFLIVTMKGINMYTWPDMSKRRICCHFGWLGVE